MLKKFVSRNFSSKIGFLTRERYPDVKRGEFGRVTDTNLQEFERILGPERVVTDPEEVAPYNVDWLKNVAGDSKTVLKPKTAEEVSAIMKICYRDRLAVCPQGGNTSLVGGSVPVFDEIVLSTSLINKIHKINTIGGTITCDAGCVLETLDTTLREEGLMMPLDLGAKGSCQIGGNISTSAGGLRLLRYGTLQANTLGLEVVLADGRILNLMNSLKKDNTGYHLRQLFIGSEGTLGVITKAVIQCPVKPNSVQLAFIGLQSYSDVLSVYSLAKQTLSEIMSSCELIDSSSFEFVLLKNLKSPLIKEFPFYMVVETHGSSEEHDSVKMSEFLEKGMSEGFIADGTFTNDPSRMYQIWQLRERITESFKPNYVYKYDITLPLDKFYEIVHVIKERLKKFKDRVKVTGFGHLGDGNIHLNVITDEYSQEIQDAVEPFIFEWTSQVNGSISAEHGIGFKKAKYLGYSKTQDAIDLMKTIKMSMDPKGILNPYKVLP